MTRSPVSNRFSRETRDTNEILNLLKTGTEGTQKTLKQIDSTLSASTPDLKKSWCLWMKVSVKEIDLSLFRSFQDQSYQMITQYFDQSTAIKQSVTGQAELQYILCNVPTGVPFVRPHRTSPFPGCHPLHHLLLLGLRSGSSQQKPPQTCFRIL